MNDLFNVIMQRNPEITEPDEIMSLYAKCQRCTEVEGGKKQELRALNKDYWEKVKDIPVAKMRLKTITINSLAFPTRYSGDEPVVTLGELAFCTESMLLKRDKFGRKSLMDVEELLKDEYGLFLGMTDAHIKD